MSTACQCQVHQITLCVVSIDWSIATLLLFYAANVQHKRVELDHQHCVGQVTSTAGSSTPILPQSCIVVAL